MFKRLDNKGNTLAIVIIGIFILSILGTLILGTTVTNYNMKANDKRAEMAFYSAEKLADELYVGIGQDVMSHITSSYTYALENYVSKRAANTSTEDTAQMLFRTRLRKELSERYEDGTLVNTSTSSTIESRLETIMLGFLSTSTEYTAEIDLKNGNNTVKYYKKVLDASGNSTFELMSLGDSVDDLAMIQLTDVGVRCKTNSSGFVSSIVTDFEITIPDMNLDFTDSASKGDIADLANYAIMCEGFHLNKDTNGRNDAPLIINNNANVVITGNVYADGTVYNKVSKTTPSGNGYFANDFNSVVKRNPSVDIGNGATVDINSKVLYCQNDFVVNGNAGVMVGNKAGTDSTNQLDSLQFYANNIIIQNYVSGSNSQGGAKLCLLGGNYYIKDDMEINGDNDTVYAGGNYFGYGLRDTEVAGIRNGVEASTAAVSAIGTFSGLSDSDEHAQSSAIIVNGKGADVYMNGANNVALPNGTSKNISGLSKLVLLGRAYIDLDPSGTTHSYMTGESVSFKGNQNVYLASADRADQLGGSLVSSNPMAQSDILSTLGVSTLESASYSALGLDGNKVIAKRISNGNVYFYLRTVDPTAQTDYFRNVLTAGRAEYDVSKKNELLKNLGADVLDVKGFRILSRTGGFDYYCSGAIMNVTRSGATADIALSNIKNTSNMNSLNTPANMVNFLNVIDNRADSIRYQLKDLSTKDNAAAALFSNFTTIGSAGEESAGTPVEKSPFEYYVDRAKFVDRVGTGNGAIKLYTFDFTSATANKALYGLDDIAATDAKATQLNNKLKDILTDAGLSPATTRVGLLLSNKADASTTTNLLNYLDAGVVVTEVPYEVNGNFTGLIMSNHSLALSSTNVNADAALVQFIFDNVVELNNVLQDDFSSAAGTETGDVVKSTSMNYTDLVKKSNWRKDNE